MHIKSKKVCKHKKQSYLCSALEIKPMIVSWCNGSTSVFGTVSQGSSPCETTQKNQTVEIQIRISTVFFIDIFCEVRIYCLFLLSEFQT